MIGGAEGWAAVRAAVWDGVGEAEADERIRVGMSVAAGGVFAVDGA